MARGRGGRTPNYIGHVAYQQIRNEKKLTSGMGFWFVSSREVARAFLMGVVLTTPLGCGQMGVVEG